MTGRSKTVGVERFRAALRESLEDKVAVEEPLEIRLGYLDGGERVTRSISITMRTPGDDEDLAAGFLFTEGIVSSPDHIVLVKPCEGDNTVRIELEDDVAVDVARLERFFYTTSSCGVCGKTSLDALHLRGSTALPPDGFAIARGALVAIPDRLRRTQPTFLETGGLHAAAAFDAAGELLVVREDVGRHNAVDKLVGALFRRGRLPAGDLGLLVSGRASFELMQKALAAGMPMLAAVSAPSSLAVDVAREFNVTLVGFLRGDTFNVYAAKERIKG